MSCNCYTVEAPGADPDCPAHGLEAMREREEQEEQLEEVHRLRAALRMFRDDYDHDPDTREHRKGYGGICRVCEATRVLTASGSS